MVKRSNVMKGEVSKSQAIRDYITQHPGVGPKAVAAALGKSGIKVSAAFVSTVKSTDKRKTHGGHGRNGSGAVSVEATMKVLQSVKQLVDQLGGVDEAKEAVDAYARLMA